jgi:hypothetical protein
VERGAQEVFERIAQAHVVDREKARIGLFITLANSTGPMRTEAVKAGFYETLYGKYPKIQILTIRELFEGKQPNILGANALSRYWTLAATGLTANLTFNYLAGDVVGTEANYKIVKYNGTFTQFTPTTLNTTTHVATLNGVSSFSDWTLAEPGAILSSNANLSNLTISAETLTPAFASGTLSYTASVSNATTSISSAEFIKAMIRFDIVR